MGKSLAERILPNLFRFAGREDGFSPDQLGVKASSAAIGKSLNNDFPCIKHTDATRHNNTYVHLGAQSPGWCDVCNFCDPRCTTYTVFQRKRTG